MLLRIPYEVRTLYQRNPLGNLAIIILTIVSFVLVWTEVIPDSMADGMVLGEESGTAYLGYQFLHAGWWHLLGNMMFLFVFGNAVCGVMNTFLYVALYLAMGVAAGAVHMLLDGGPAVGASGALCGVMGLYLAIYPQNEINCFWFFMVRGGTVGLAGWLLILFWFSLDLFGAFGGKGNVAHWAHIGGTVTGFVTGLILLKLGRIDLYDYDNPTVLQILSRERAS